MNGFSGKPCLQKFGPDTVYGEIDSECINKQCIEIRTCYTANNPHDLCRGRFYLLKTHISSFIQTMQFFHGHIFEVVWVDQWFSEGLCEYVSGQFELPVIRTMDQLNSWYNGSDHINPIKIHKNSNFPLPSSRFGEYYPVFEKAVEYLVDKKGLGKIATR